jgi:predicted Zn-dependent protease
LLHEAIGHGLEGDFNRKVVPFLVIKLANKFLVKSVLLLIMAH